MKKDIAQIVASRVKEAERLLPNSEEKDNTRLYYMITPVGTKVYTTPEKQALLQLRSEFNEFIHEFNNKLARLCKLSNDDNIGEPLRREWNSIRMNLNNAINLCYAPSDPVKYSQSREKLYDELTNIIEKFKNLKKKPLINVGEMPWIMFNAVNALANNNNLVEDTIQNSVNDRPRYR